MKDSTRPDGKRVPLGKLQGLLQEFIPKAAEGTLIDIRRRAGGFTAVTLALISEFRRHLNRATGYDDINLLKKKVEEQGHTAFCIAGVAHKFTIATPFFQSSR